MLGNRKNNNVSPIYQKSKKISKVCHGAKDAETRNIIMNVDTAVYLSRQLSILLFDDTKSRIPVKQNMVVFKDNEMMLLNPNGQKEVI